MDGINRINQTGQLDRWSSFIAQGTQPDSKQGGGPLLGGESPFRNRRASVEEQNEEEPVYHLPRDKKSIEYSRKMQDINSEIEALSALDRYLDSPAEEDAMKEAQFFLSRSAGPSAVELLNRLLTVSEDGRPDQEEIVSLREMSSTAKKQLEDYLAANRSSCEESEDALSGRILSDHTAAVSGQCDLKSNRVLQLLIPSA